MQQALRISTTIEEKKKKHLREAIFKKRKLLQQWTEKLEVLRMDLDMIRHEYQVRVGALVLKDNQLDLEILQLRNLKQHIDEGMTYAQALRMEEEMFYSEILRMQKEQEAIDEEKKILDNRKDVPEEVVEDVKTLWKSLIRKYHPDLVMDSQEKLRREELMKQINNAYATLDIKALQQFENQMHINSIDALSVEQLENALIETGEMIDMVRREYQLLRKSEWYNWKQKKKRAHTTHDDVFTELEKQLLDGIVKKIEIVRRLREEVVPPNRIKI